MRKHRVDHVEEALAAVNTANVVQGMDEFAHADLKFKEAQVHATLALVDEVKQLRESFGQCDHGYTICPFCIRNAMEGVLR
ncbi:hypothetical protein [Paramicrobacterium agarici]|uniref:hypothetical protein n=1 Tax=Paramicrobacterium agarici TaxID=630514 RepID=UPI001154C7CD|nr:hypothetical protein [Microbacterium agarici]TQO23809.1 hypothetical protein FB385_2671 [Microbacterium agarici]